MFEILLVDDYEMNVEILEAYLKKSKLPLNMHKAYDGKSALEILAKQKMDIVLLDVMLPLMDGFEVLKKLRETSSLPVIMVTAREEERDKILGLETGADDYITKPFSVKELAARIKANIRRSAGIVTAGGGSEFGPFAIDRLMQTVSKNGKPLELSQREYDIISYFLKNPSRVVSREEFMEKVWGFDYYGDLRAVDVAMRRLREKLEDDPAEPRYLMTKRGAGYYLKI